MSASINPSTTADGPGPAAPLTTTFKPSPDCLSDYYREQPGSYILLGPASPKGSSSCFPPGWQPQNHFSPGLCPSGYTIACSSLDVIATLTETRAVCCPSGYYCQNDNRYTYYRQFQCTADNKRDVVLPPTITLTAINDGGTSIAPWTLRPNDGINAYGVSIRFMEGEFTIPSQTPSPTTLNPSSSVATTASTAETGAASESSTAKPSSGISNGAKIGIGVGVALGVSLVAVLIFLLFKYRSRRWRPYEPYLPAAPPAEIDSRSPPVYKPPPVEAPGDDAKMVAGHPAELASPTEITSER